MFAGLLCETLKAFFNNLVFTTTFTAEILLILRD